MLNNCSLGDDGVPSYEDTCSFTCNTGYELTGSDTRTCQSDGSWSGSDQVCRRGEYICNLSYLMCIYNISYFSTLDDCLAIFYIYPIKEYACLALDFKKL